jgi:type II secretory pathway component PulK
MVLMATIVMVVVVVASFLKVESSLAAVKQAEAVARLNALGALRLAGAALQERLGPDTRVSAPASLYDISGRGCFRVSRPGGLA